MCSWQVQPIERRQCEQFVQTVPTRKSNRRVWRVHVHPLPEGDSARFQEQQLQPVPCGNVFGRDVQKLHEVSERYILPFVWE